MNKDKLYLFVIAGLLLSNILMVYFSFAKEGHSRPKPRDVVIERLHFSENQIKQFDDIIRHHQEIMAVKGESMKALKYELYLNLQDRQSRVKADSLIMEIGIIQKDIENLLYSHFEGIKKLCDESQIDDFNKLTHELAKLFAPLPKKRT